MAAVLEVLFDIVTETFFEIALWAAAKVFGRFRKESESGRYIELKRGSEGKDE